MDTTAKRKTLKETAYDYIKERILSCEYLPGSYLNEQQLCDEIGISRTPVRDALSRLEQEGLLNILPKKGLIISGLNLKDINQAYEARLLLEPYAISKYGKDYDIEKLKEFEIVMSDPGLIANSLSLSYEVDDNFHRFIMSVLPNQYLLDTYENTVNMNQRLRILTGMRVENRISRTFSEHLTIVQHCLNKDWEQASEAMAAHLESARVATIQLLKDTARYL